MSKGMLNMPVAAVLAAGAAALSVAASDTASAMPLAGSLALSETAGTEVVPVWWYREWGSGSAPALRGGGATLLLPPLSPLPLLHLLQRSPAAGL
jgi:hypothetical protein